VLIKAPSKADIRGSIPLAFFIGVSLVNTVDATRPKNMALAMRAATSAVMNAIQWN